MLRFYMKSPLDPPFKKGGQLDDDRTKSLGFIPLILFINNNYLISNDGPADMTLSTHDRTLLFNLVTALAV